MFLFYYLNQIHITIHRIVNDQLKTIPRVQPHHIMHANVVLGNSRNRRNSGTNDERMRKHLQQSEHWAHVCEVDFS